MLSADHAWPDVLCPTQKKRRPIGSPDKPQLAQLPGLDDRRRPCALLAQPADPHPVGQPAQCGSNSMCPTQKKATHWVAFFWCWCRRRDLNPHEINLTTPSRWRVYQFHHFGYVRFSCPSANRRSVLAPEYQQFQSAPQPSVGRWSTPLRLCF